MDLTRGTCLWAALSTWAGLASAVTAPQPEAAAERGYSLQYWAAPSCPDAAALAQAIESRTPGAVQQGPEVAAAKLRVELREDGTSTLWIDLPEGSSRREFPQAACADALASIAVIASMVLEADASERVATAQTLMDRVAPTAPSAEPTTPSAPAIGPPVAAAPVDAPPPAAPPAPPAPRSNRARELAPATGPSRLRFAVAAGALLESAVASDAPLGASAGVTAWLEPRQPSPWLPSIRLEAIATLPATVQASPGDVKLGLVAGRLHVCPLRLPVVASLQLVPCLTGDLGVLSARGTGKTVNPRQPTMPWVALGGTLRAQLALGRTLGVESWLGLRGLARSDTFVFGSPDSRGLPAYQVPSWSLGAGLGLSLALP
jgi:hypothetical protein